MARAVFRHFNDPKANQLEQFAPDDITELTFGRDPAASRSFDADKDDLVSRRHATALSATREPPGAVVAEQRSVQGDAGLNPTARLRRPSDDGLGSPLHALLARPRALPSPPDVASEAADDFGPGLLLPQVRGQCSLLSHRQPSKVKKFKVEIVPCGGTYDVYRKGRFLQRTGPDLSPLSIAATEGKFLPGECKTKNVNVAPIDMKHVLRRKLRHRSEDRHKTCSAVPASHLVRLPRET